MAELRQITRRLDQLEETVKAGVPSAATTATDGAVAVLERRVADLEHTVQAYKKFLDDALSKLGQLEQKVVAVETKVCQCGSECSGVEVLSAPEPEAPQVMTTTENPMYLETDDEEA